MASEPQRDTRKILPRILLLVQIFVLVAAGLGARTTFEWLWTVISFLPTAALCLFYEEKRFVLLSLVILFISQSAVFVFSRPAWGYSYMHDSINDFSMASVISENAHFELGKIGYGTQTYTYYPMLHIFSVLLSKISGISLTPIALYGIPMLNASFTAAIIYFLSDHLFELKGRTRNLATLLFAMAYYFTFYQSQFVREAFAFPLALLAILIFVKMSRLSGCQYSLVLVIVFGTVVLAHHITSYLLLLIFVVLTIGFNLKGNKKLNLPLLLMAVILLTYVSFVTVNVVVGQSASIYESFLLVLGEERRTSLMSSASLGQTYLAFTYYFIIGACVLVEASKLRSKKVRRTFFSPPILLAAFFLLIFAFSVLFRFSVKASAMSWAYDMSLRGTIWAFMGLSFIMALAAKSVLKLANKIDWRKFLIVSCLICIMAAGKFAQYPAIVSQSSVPIAVTYSRYVASSWLKMHGVHGSYLLVAPDSLDAEAFEASRDMAPYAYLFIYVIGSPEEHSYYNFKGYVPLIGGFFDQFKASMQEQTIYDDGETQVGYKS